MPPEQKPGIQWRTGTWYSLTAAVILFVAVFGIGLYLGKESAPVPAVAPAVQKEVVATSSSQATTDTALLAGRINTNDWLTYSNTQYGFAIKYDPSLKPDTSGRYGIVGFVPVSASGREVERCQFATTTVMASSDSDIETIVRNASNPIYSGVTGQSQQQTYADSSIRTVSTTNDLEGILVYVPGNFFDSSHYFFITPQGTLDFMGTITDGQLLSSCDAMLSTLVRI